MSVMSVTCILAELTSPFCRNFVVSTATSEVVHVNIQSGIPQILLHKESEPIHAVACHPKLPVVVMGNLRGVLKVWDYDNKVIICSKVFETGQQIQCVTFDPQGEPTFCLTEASFTHLLHGLSVSHSILQCTQ